MTEEEQAKQAALKQLVQEYKLVFGSDEGKRVLEDLKRRCHYYTSTNVKGDSHDSAFLEGQRAAVLFIDNVLKQKEK